MTMVQKPRAQFMLTNSSSRDRPRITSGITSGAKIMPENSVRPGKRAMRVERWRPCVPSTRASVAEDKGNPQGHPGRIEQRLVVQQWPVPLQREAAPDGDQLDALNEKSTSSTIGR